MPLPRTFLERVPVVTDEEIDRLEDLLRSKMQHKTGYAEAQEMARLLTSELRRLNKSDDGVLDKENFFLVMKKLNCGQSHDVVDALFYRHDLMDTGNITHKEFADGIFMLRKVPMSSPECRAALLRLRFQLASQSPNRFCRLGHLLGRHRVASKGEMLSALQQCDVNLGPEELDTITYFFATETAGRVVFDVERFLIGIRPRMSEPRRALVRLAFEALPKDANGQISFEELNKLFLPEKHPAVLKGDSKEDVLQEFSEGWSHFCRGDEISVRNFVDFYTSIGASIDNDAYFEMVVRNTWEVGKDALSKKSATVQVKVTHLDGTHSTELLEGVPEDNDELIAALRRSGVTDILKAQIV